MKIVKNSICFVVLGVVVMMAQVNPIYAATIEATPTTINSILSTVNPGDVIQLRAGNYSPIVLGRSGYTVTNYPGERPVFDGGSANVQIEIIGTSINLKGNLWLKNSRWAGVRAAKGSQNIVIDGIEVSYTQSHSIISSGKNVTIQNCYVHDAILGNAQRREGSGWGSCIKGEFGSDGLIIKNNLVEHCYGEGIALTMTINSMVVSNTVRTSWAVGIYVDNVENATLDKNFITCADPAWWRSTKGTPGVAVSAEDYPGYNWTYRLKNVTLSNNVIVGCQGVSVWDYGVGVPAVNMRIINNTVKDMPSGAAYYVENVPGQSVTILNNIGSTYFTSNNGLVQSNNVSQSTSTFIGGAIDNPSSAKLKADIPGIDTGIKDDFGGSARNLPLSVGAWEFGATPGLTQMPLPTKIPTSEPGAITSLAGDANGDGLIGLVDFSIWKKEYLAQIATKTADFNGDTKVDLADFSIWKKGYLGD